MKTTYDVQFMRLLASVSAYNGFNYEIGATAWRRDEAVAVTPDENFSDDSITAQGVTLHRVPKHMKRALAWSAPEWYQKFSATVSMMTPGENLLSLTKQMIAETVSSYDLVRLTQQQKDYLLEWIYDGCETWGRNRHEKAALVTYLLQGSNSILRPEVHEPKLGAMGKTGAILTHAVAAFRRLGLHAPSADEFILDLFREAGVKEDVLETQSMAYKLHEIMVMGDVRGTLQGYTTGLALMCIQDGRHSELDVQELYTSAMVNTSVAPFYNNLITVVRQCQWMMTTAHSPSRFTDDDMDTFVDTAIARLGRRIAARKKREGS